MPCSALLSVGRTDLYPEQQTPVGLLHLFLARFRLLGALQVLLEPADVLDGRLQDGALVLPAVPRYVVVPGTRSARVYVAAPGWFRDGRGEAYVKHRAGTTADSIAGLWQEPTVWNVSGASDCGDNAGESLIPLTCVPPIRLLSRKVSDLDSRRVLQQCSGDTRFALQSNLLYFGTPGSRGLVLVPKPVHTS